MTWQRSGGPSSRNEAVSAAWEMSANGRKPQTDAPAPRRRQERVPTAGPGRWATAPAGTVSWHCRWRVCIAHGPQTRETAWQSSWRRAEEGEDEGEDAPRDSVREMRDSPRSSSMNSGTSLRYSPIALKTTRGLRWTWERRAAGARARRRAQRRRRLGMVRRGVLREEDRCKHSCAWWWRELERRVRRSRRRRFVSLAPLHPRPRSR